MNKNRIFALVYRYLTLLRRDLGKIIDTFYWPLIDIISWGFMTLYLDRNHVVLGGVANTLLSAMILWTLVYSLARDIAVSFLDDVWDRNVVNLYGSPLQPTEFLLASFIVALLRVLFSTVILIIVANLLFSVNALALGGYFFVAYMLLVIFSYTLGIFAATLILKFGPGVEIVAWSTPAILLPVSAVFFPLDVLPKFLQNIAHFVPTSYVFENMRAYLIGQPVNLGQLGIAFILNLIYLLIFISLFLATFNNVRKDGTITRFS